MSKVSHILTAAAGFALGAGVTAAALMQEEQVSVTQPASSAPLQNSFRVAVIKSVSADILHARAHIWPGEDVVFSVCARGRVQGEKPCHYEAEFALVSNGAATLRNLAPATGMIAVHAVRPVFETRRAKDEVIAGPVKAEVLRLKDGDTVQVRAEPFPNHFAVMDVRIGGIDTPEKGGRAACPAEAALAVRASELTRGMVEGRRVTLTGVQFEKYGGRVLADMQAPAGGVAQALIEKGLARRYDGGKKQSWC